MVRARWTAEGVSARAKLSLLPGLSNREVERIWRVSFGASEKRRIELFLARS